MLGIGIAKEDGDGDALRLDNGQSALDTVTCGLEPRQLEPPKGSLCSALTVFGLILVELL